MASTLVKIVIHLIFHVKSTGVRMREADLPHIFAYIGGIINNVSGIPIEIGGRPDHVHILASLPKTMALADFARAIKANSSRRIKDINGYYAQFAWQERVWGVFSKSVVDGEGGQLYQESGGTP